jgi:hypothetical protein
MNTPGKTVAYTDNSNALCGKPMRTPPLNHMFHALVHLRA